MDTSHNIMKADKKLRLVVLTVCAGMLGIGAFLILQLREFLSELATHSGSSTHETIEKATSLFQVMTVLIGASAIGFGAYVARIALGTIRSSQFPPPDTAVIVDTKIITGRTARFRGIVLMLFAVLLIIGGLGIPLFSWSVLSSLTGEHL